MKNGQVDGGFTLFQNQATEISVEATPKHAVLRLKGHFNEDVTFIRLLPELAELIKAKREFVIDLGGVTKINSCGVREWVLFLEKLQSVVIVSFSRVSEICVEHACMVPALLGKPGTRVMEFIAPYYCEDCKVHEQVTLTRQDFDNRYSFPVRACARCKKPIQADVLESSYVQFLRRLAA